MSLRERWIVYPLLTLAVALAVSTQFSIRSQIQQELVHRSPDLKVRGLAGQVIHANEAHFAVVDAIHVQCGRIVTVGPNNRPFALRIVAGEAPDEFRLQVEPLPLSRPTPKPNSPEGTPETDPTPTTPPEPEKTAPEKTEPEKPESEKTEPEKSEPKKTDSEP